MIQLSCLRALREKASSKRMVKTENTEIEMELLVFYFNEVC